MEPVGVTEILLKQYIASFITPFTTLFQSKQKTASIRQR
nr:MAG TPA: hypothetical protein [Caudoviricetes sp.]